MSWIQTYTGEVFNPMRPTTPTIHMEDIAHALSMICRFNGHCREFYSVAEHCVRMSELVAPEFALHALMHDAAEAYVSDVSRPIKPHIIGFQNIEDAIMDTIDARFGICYTPRSAKAVKEADLRMLATERARLMAICKVPWDTLDGIEPYPIALGCWEPARAKRKFLQRYAEVPQP